MGWGTKLVPSKVAVLGGPVTQSPFDPALQETFQQMSPTHWCQNQPGAVCGQAQAGKWQCQSMLERLQRNTLGLEMVLY